MAAEVKVVPWLNKEEWMSVYSALFSEKQDVVWALGRIVVWKTRSSPNILPEIDATEALFRAKVHASCDSLCRGRYNEAMLHSLAITRFVKLISELGLKKGIDSVSRAARLFDIPEWLVKLRHDVSHSAMPSFEMLRVGVDFALHWLKSYYWDKENDRSNTVASVSDNTLVNIEESLRKDMDRFCQLQLQRNPNAISLSNVLNSIYLKAKHHITILSKILVEPGYLLPTYQQLKDILDEKELNFLSNKSTLIPDSLLNFWSPVLKLYDQKTNYCYLLYKLLSSSQPHCSSMQRRLIATWIIYFFNCSKVKTWQRTSHKGLSLDWDKMLTEALVCYNEYSPDYLTLMLEDPSVIIPEDKKQHLMALVAIRLGKTMDALPRTIAKETNRIYTTVDLQKANPGLHMDNAVVDMDNEVQWKICTDPVDWRMYPLGILPGQTSPNVFEKVHVQEQLKNSLSEDMDIACNVTEVLPERCFQEINSIEDNDSVPTKMILKHIMFL